MVNGGDFEAETDMHVVIDFRARKLDILSIKPPPGRLF